MTNRFGTWVALVVVALCLVAAAALAFMGYITATATPIHPVARDIPAVTRLAPASRWSASVVQGRALARAAASDGNLPGLSVAVGVGTEIVWAEGFGWADLARRTPVTPETQFRIGTASTVLTAAAVGLLVDRGRLTLDALVQTSVPAFPAKDAPITLRHLMAQTAGLGNDGGDEGPLFSRHCERPLDALPDFATDPLRFTPGTQYRPSSYGWILVSAAVEAAAGEPFLRFMRKQVFEPLGMDDTGAESGAGSGAERATPYFPRFAADPRYGPDLMRHIDLSCYAGASVFLSTPSDLVRFGTAMWGGTLLPATAVAALQANAQLASGEPTGHGLGWDVGTATLGTRATRVVGRDGAVLGGRVATLATFPDLGIVVAVTSNTSYADTAALATRLAEVFATRQGG